jgi:Transcriptional regulators
VKKKIAGMIEHGIIEEFACNINMAKFGYHLSFITMVRIVNANNSEKIAKKLMKISEIYSVDMITGEYDLILRGYSKDQADLYNILSKIQFVEGIDHLFTNIIIKIYGHQNCSAGIKTLFFHCKIFSYAIWIPTFKVNQSSSIHRHTTVYTIPG